MKPFKECYEESQALYQKMSPLFDDVDPFVTMIVLAQLFAAWMMTQEEDRLDSSVLLFHRTARDVYDDMCDSLEAEGTLQ
jgi:hypothetical protein